jgi:DNA-binding NarL/FixJ family response regulator
MRPATQREFDIATRVGNGESNKQIAQACDITERTVKAHLTSIYFKLSVSDRLNLALVMSSDNRRAILHSDSLLNGGSRVNDSKL